MQPSLTDKDPYLLPYQAAIDSRRDTFVGCLQQIQSEFSSLETFASWHQQLGFFWKEDTFIYREWAPGASQLFFTGDFNAWQAETHPLTPIGDGVWELRYPAEQMQHGTQVKVRIVSAIGAHNRIPAYARSCLQDPNTHSFNALLWNPKGEFAWSDQNFCPAAEPPIIYECHIGMGTEEERVGSFREFADTRLPYIAALGYNTLQVMGVAEHPYYGSFGYHVSNLFAVSSRFGSPDDFKYFVNAAHNLGLQVIMDVIHSHAVKNFYEGLNQFDGTDHQYFYPPPKGYHALWDSLLYDYGKPEVQRFLLSNLRFWLEEYHIDGFRFDGVTSMLYSHHGQNKDFVHYDMYFSDEVENDAITYLQLANTLVHRINPGALTLAEDMSGMPGLCRPIAEGGMGFDYRFAMGVPDNWIKLIKEHKDEDWSIASIYHMLTDRRVGEMSIGYCESHDQALVGDKTIAFRLMDKEMYWSMSKHTHSLIIDRGIALHKLIRLCTLCLGGEGYLNFMGNEFGHPEWIDFPREGNGYSYKYARRQWSLKDNPDLRYELLLNWDQSMLALTKDHGLLEGEVRCISLDQRNQVLVFEKSELIFVVSFNPSESLSAYRIGVPEAKDYRILIHSDDEHFGGFGRIDATVEYPVQAVPLHGYQHSIELYLTNRTALIFAKKS